jgi:hypothetical protein
MEFLEINEICAWAEQHGLARGDGFAVKLPDLPSIWRRQYASGDRAGCERRSLKKAPGHRFDRGEIVLLGQLLTLIMENAWDADILCTRQGRADRVRGEISHDEWCEIFERP